ncbi:MAG: PEP-CTERM sorting domain-containing protein [Luteolibacter sp.]
MLPPVGQSVLRSLMVASLIMVSPVSAIIVGGEAGDGTNNADESGLQTLLANSSLPAFPYWGNMLRYSDASGIYLGYNADTMEGWVLSAEHITEGTGIKIGGYTYSFIDPQPANSNVNGTRIISSGVNTDLMLYKFSVTGSNPIPALPKVEVMDTTPSVGSLLIMAGRGMRSGAGTGSEDLTAPYSWGTPGTSDSVPMRWGFNQMEFNYIDPNGAKFIVTDFDAPGFGTGFDGQAALGDSGGGAFILDQGKWKLGGVAYATADGSDADAAVNPAGYGDLTLYSNVYAYRSEITALTGTLVPEPSSMLLGGFGVLALVTRRRR